MVAEVVAMVVATMVAMVAEAGCGTGARKATTNMAEVPQTRTGHAHPRPVTWGCAGCAERVPGWAE